MEKHEEMKNSPYRAYGKLLWMVIISFNAMFVLMYSMVDHFSNVILNLNQFYMVGCMTAAMMLIEIVFMKGMYKNKRWNGFIVSIGVIGLIGCFLMIRYQTGISDKQFLKSMIPHHAAAVLMVEQTEIQDTGIQRLARGIVETQQREIEYMKIRLNELENK